MSRDLGTEHKINAVGTYLLKDANECKAIVRRAVQLGYRLIGKFGITHYTFARLLNQAIS